MLQLWNDMWDEGNWIPSFPDSLDGLTAETAAWKPEPQCHSVWEEVVHVTYWRTVTLDKMAGKPGPSEQDVELLEFALPEVLDDVAWTAAMDALKATQEGIAAAIRDEEIDVSRVTYHLVHDPYHLGRITQVRHMQGSKPKF